MRLLTLALLIFISIVPALAQQTPGEKTKFETTYDAEKNRTTVRLLPVKISGEKDKYYRLHMSPSFSYAGQAAATPSVVDFELQTVVKGRLKTDLYVVFIIDGETVFLSSNRWAVKQPIPGRVWMGERLVFRMPYETLLKISKAKKLEIKMDAVRFEVGENELQIIRDFAERPKSLSDVGQSRGYTCFLSHPETRPYHVQRTRKINPHSTVSSLRQTFPRQP